MNGLEQKVATLHFQPDEEYCHLRIEHPQLCGSCSGQPCLTLCPTGVFRSVEAENAIHIRVEWKRCLECGACRLGCPAANILFTYPRKGHGVLFRDG